MAATLASVCSVPLTSVLLLFELTKDYRILLPLMVSVKCQCSLTIFFVSQHINISYFRRVVNKGEYCELKVMYQRKAGFPLVAIVH
jgi:H+/Cl- antiporter ClcA